MSQARPFEGLKNRCTESVRAASNPMTTSRFALPIDHTSLPLWCDTNASSRAAMTGGRSAAPARTAHTTVSAATSDVENQVDRRIAKR